MRLCCRKHTRHWHNDTHLFAPRCRRPHFGASPKPSPALARARRCQTHGHLSQDRHALLMLALSHQPALLWRVRAGAASTSVDRAMAMIRLFVLALLVAALATFSACSGFHWVRPVPPIPTVRPHVVPAYKCERWHSRYCQLSPNWREI